MKLPNLLVDQAKDESGKTLAEYQNELRVKLAKQQFQRLQQLGLSISVRVA